MQQAAASATTSLRSGPQALRSRASAPTPGHCPHGCMGRNVPHDHSAGRPPRRHDGDIAVRPSRYRSLHRRQAAARRALELQPLVLVTDAFMTAVERDEDWPLVFAGRCSAPSAPKTSVGQHHAATYDYAEPGVISSIGSMPGNNQAYCETISATNPCGEEPLRPMALACSSINLAGPVRQPFTPDARIDEERARRARAHCVCDDWVQHDRTFSRFRWRSRRRSETAHPVSGSTGLRRRADYDCLRYGSAAAAGQAGDGPNAQSAIPRLPHTPCDLDLEKGGKSAVDRGGLLPARTVGASRRYPGPGSRRRHPQCAAHLDSPRPATISLFARQRLQRSKPVFAELHAQSAAGDGPHSRRGVRICAASLSAAPR